MTPLRFKTSDELQQEASGIDSKPISPEGSQTTPQEEKPLKQAVTGLPKGPSNYAWNSPELQKIDIIPSEKK